MSSQTTVSIPIVPTANNREHAVSKERAIGEFSGLVGQSTAVSLLGGAIATNRIAPAYLFAGVDGVGKTLAARTFIAQLFDTHNLTNHPDLLWVEPTYLDRGELVNQSELAHSEVKPKSPPQIRIEQIRVVTQFLSCRALTAPSKVVVIQDADRMAASAANALLKTLEEPTSGSIILISSQPQKLLPTIASRCQAIPFHRLNGSNMIRVLERLGNAEITNDRAVVALAAGSPGQAIAHYNQLQTMPKVLVEQLELPPTNALNAMRLAKEIDTMLDFERQLWLLDYLQHLWWRSLGNTNWIEKLEAAKAALLKMASSRLVWEVLLLGN
ncbi:AAA family ATPase [Chroococcidiopsis thermalis]|uniref:DNA polymerase III subunit delta n=1 Tax=Chroococcidiopsis thermalis (strain PCC 7203) TaxID=251229 RepID=K9U3W6_CHRTP|nr:AAA family ATPase [Chroococcidiopsis thermalis]AFY89313.1 DNA polymerase III subunit delta' [Chroococcidiopsis thermalis PCC 7203]